MIIIQDLNDPKSFFDTNNKPKEKTPDEARLEVENTILATIVMNCFVRDSRLASNMNII